MRGKLPKTTYKLSQKLSKKRIFPFYFLEFCNFVRIMWFLMDYAESCNLRSIMRNRNTAEYQKPCDYDHVQCTMFCFALMANILLVYYHSGLTKLLGRVHTVIFSWLDLNIQHTLYTNNVTKTHFLASLWKVNNWWLCSVHCQSQKIK